MDKNLEQKINSLEQKLKTLEEKYAVHQHNDTDGTLHLRKNFFLDYDQAGIIGDSQHQTFRAFSSVDGWNYILGTIIGTNTTPGASNKSPNLQMVLTHIPNQASKFSFLTAERNPLFLSFENTSISTTAAGNTVTIVGFNFVTNELAGAYIDIFDSTGVLIETQTIASNTAIVVTIVGTWLATTTGTFKIYTPVFLGRTDTIFRRLYVEEGLATGGVRFGVGSTNNTQNGLLYMDAAGDLYWRDKAGVSHLISSGGGGFLEAGDGAGLMLASGVLNAVTGFVRVVTEGGAASDDLDTITVGSLPEGSLIVLVADNSTETVVVKNGTGNIQLAGSDFTMDNKKDTIMLILTQSNWLEVSRSNNGA
jgi:hypothetical protein